MSPSCQGELKNLWAVGGKQAEPAGDERKNRQYTYCPGCGWKLTGKFSTCPRCEADLRTKECLYCGGVIPADVKFCPRCTAQQADFSKLNN